MRTDSYRKYSWSPAMPAADERLVMTVKEVSGYLRCHPSTIYRFVERGEIPHFRLGSDIRFLRSSIDRWIENRSNPKRSARTR
jgi:excisionase family DNA binding protein